MPFTANNKFGLQQMLLGTGDNSGLTGETVGLSTTDMVEASKVVETHFERIAKLSTPQEVHGDIQQKQLEDMENQLDHETKLLKIQNALNRDGMKISQFGALGALGGAERIADESDPFAHLEGVDTTGEYVAKFGLRAAPASLIAKNRRFGTRGQQRLFGGMVNYENYMTLERVVGPG